MSQLFPYPFNPALGTGSSPVFLPLATMSFYLTGTTTLAVIYNATGDALSNPITANAYGQFPPIYLDNSTTYRVVLKDRFGALVPGGDIDPVNQNDTTLQTFMAGFSPGLATFFSGASPLPISDGGTGATSGSAARSALGAAASGANSDITSLTGLSTLLTVAQGGTGVASLAALIAALGFTGAGSATSGHADIPLGTFGTLRVNWGSQLVGSNVSTTATLHANFSTGFVAVGGASGGGTGDGDNYYVYLASNSTVGLINGTQTLNISWIAIGLA